jgi:hypothetical protein
MGRANRYRFSIPESIQSATKYIVSRVALHGAIVAVTEIVAVYCLG